MMRSASFLGLFLLAASFFQHAVAQGQQQFGQPPNTHLTWQSSPPPNGTIVDVTYFIGAGFSAAETTAIRNSAAVWNNAGGGMRLREVGSAAASGIDVLRANLGAGPTLATFNNTTAAGGPNFGDGNPWLRITSSDLTLNNNPAFSWGTGPVGAGQFDFNAVMIDLFGLSLGLGFAGAGDPNSVMRNTFGPGPQNQALSPQDIRALVTLYGSPEPATWALFGVGLAALGSGLRRRKQS